MSELERQGSRRRILSLIRKEINQIRRDRRLAVALIVPPIAQILLFGFALDSTVSNLRLGVLDYSKTPISREFIAQLSQSESASSPTPATALAVGCSAIERGEIDDGVTIPYDLGGATCNASARSRSGSAQCHQR